MAVSDEVKIRILTDIKQSTKALAALGISVGGVVLAFRQVVRFLGEAEQEFFKQEQATAKLTAVLKATGGAAGYTAEEMKDMASEMQRLTVFEDDHVGASRVGDIHESRTRCIPASHESCGRYVHCHGSGPPGQYRAGRQGVE